MVLNLTHGLMKPRRILGHLVCCTHAEDASPPPSLCHASWLAHSLVVTRSREGEEKAWQEYCQWQNEDKKTLKRINTLIKDIMRSTYTGIGKPEPLKENLNGWWSRRIDNVNRIVYCEKDGAIIIASCKSHYEN